jgi:hypothetical protein
MIDKIVGADAGYKLTLASHPDPLHVWRGEEINSTRLDFHLPDLSIRSFAGSKACFLVCHRARTSSRMAQLVVPKVSSMTAVREEVLRQTIDFTGFLYRQTGWHRQSYKGVVGTELPNKNKTINQTKGKI